MNRFYITLSICCLFSLGGTAQTKNVDIDNVWFNFAFRTTPIEPQNPIRFAYFVNMNVSSVAKQNLQMDALRDAVRIEGQTRTAYADSALITLTLSIGDILIRSSNVVERREESKDKSGKVTVYNYYHTEIIYTFESSYKIEIRDKAVRNIPIHSRSREIVYKTREYRTRKEAADYWNNNREVHLSTFYSNHTTETVDNMTAYLSERFGFPIHTGLPKLTLKTMDEKKHDENTNFRTEVNSLKETLEAATPNTPPDAAMKSIFTGYFKNILTKYTDPKRKADIRLRYAAYYNLCMIYLCFDEPEKVGEYADKLIANDYNKYEGEKMNDLAKELKAQFDRSGIRTRHFDPETFFSNR
ncbi:MAG: hypothetical protein LBG92_10865 [Prevotellaceae bacterium]|jgi:hypothetical protein|nr:hypothetical protein [Prevotellaceae bacterium]